MRRQASPSAIRTQYCYTASQGLRVSRSSIEHSLPDGTGESPRWQVDSNSNAADAEDMRPFLEQLQGGEGGQLHEVI